MTLPNKLTLIRILVIPIMIILFYVDVDWLNSRVGTTYVTWLYLIEFCLFALASITDFFDGWIARKYKLVSSFGKFADPLADKMLVFTAMGILMVTYYEPGKVLIPMWVVMVILIREFMVSGIRMVVSERGVVIAAGMMGKLKTVFTMFALGFLFWYGLADWARIVGEVLMYISCALTIISGIEYFWKSRKIILESI